MTAPDACRKIDAIETIIGSDVGRNVTPLLARTRGGLKRAADSLARHPSPHVAILTGFFVPWAAPPLPETDGPVGAAHLAAGLTSIGLPVRIVTDDLCCPAIQAALAAVGLAQRVAYDLVPITPDGSFDAAAEISSSWRSMTPPVSHLIAIERVGPTADGCHRNMRGESIDRWTAPLHLLFQKSPGMVTIGIGDGGNELGMGNLPPALIAASVSQGRRIACTTGCDFLIVCGVSNWGAVALIAALSLLRADLRQKIATILTIDREYHILKALVENQLAVDGVTGQISLSVDGLPFRFHAAILQKIVNAMASPV